jgi:quercetin dioxygenase-like cupin family protein
MNNYVFVENLAGSASQIPADSIVSRSLLKQDGLDVTLFGFAQGQALSEHTAPYSAIIEIISGEAKLVLGGDEITAKPGAWIYMPANLPHALEALTPLVMLLTMVKK